MGLVLPKRVVETGDFERAWNMMRDYVAAIMPLGSDDILVNTTQGGTTFKLVKKAGAGTTANSIVTVWDENKPYKTGDWVKVDCRHTYSIPYEVASGSATPPLCAGVFQCLQSVPSGSGRNSYNYYYPICPTIPTSSVATVMVSGSLSGSLANQTFWFPVAPMIKTTYCINNGNDTKTVFVNSESPDDVFDLTQLPYSGSS